MKPNITFLGVVITLIQLFDIAIHSAIDQLEPLRVASNVALLFWLALAASGRIRVHARQMGIACLDVYLLLNALFLAQEGITNPVQDGAARWMLILLIVLTLVLAVIYSRHLSK